MRFFDPRRGGYIAVELTDDPWRSDSSLVDTMQRFDSGVSRLATWATERDNPGVVEG